MTDLLITEIRSSCPIPDPFQRFRSDSMVLKADSKHPSLPATFTEHGLAWEVKGRGRFLLPWSACLGVGYQEVPQKAAEASESPKTPSKRR